jgi:hypothetical protein
MPDTTSRPLRAQVWALAGTFLPAALVAVIAYTVATSIDDTSCDGFNCASFGYGVISAYAAFTAPLVGVLGQLATASLGAAWPSLRIHPARLGLLGALLSWTAFGLIATTTL